MAALTGMVVPDSLPATRDALHQLAEHVLAASRYAAREPELYQVICVEPALSYDNVTLLTGARVTRLETGPSGRSVQRVLVTRDGAREEYSADLVVLAANTINSVQMGKSDLSDRLGTRVLAEAAMSRS